MREFMYNPLAGIHVHASHSKALLIAGIVIVLWAFVSVPAALLMGGVIRLLGHKDELPEEIIEVPTGMPAHGRVA